MGDRGRFTDIGPYPRSGILSEGRYRDAVRPFAVHAVQAGGIDQGEFPEGFPPVEQEAVGFPGAAEHLAGQGRKPREQVVSPPLLELPEHVRNPGHLPGGRRAELVDAPVPLQHLPDHPAVRLVDQAQVMDGDHRAGKRYAQHRNMLIVRKYAEIRKMQHPDAGPFDLHRMPGQLPGRIGGRKTGLFRRRRQHPGPCGPGGSGKSFNERLRSRGLSDHQRQNDGHPSSHILQISAKSRKSTSAAGQASGVDLM